MRKFLKKMVLHGVRSERVKYQSLQMRVRVCRKIQNLVQPFHVDDLVLHALIVSLPS